MQLIKPLGKWFNKIILAFLVVSFVTMIVLVAAQVFTRYCLNYSMAWGEEISRYLLVWTVLFGTVLVYEEHGHVWVANLVDALPRVPQKIVLLISYLIQFVFFTAVLWGSYIYLPTAQLRTSPVNLLPMNLVYMCVPIAAFCMEIYCIRDIVKLFAGGDQKQ